jgi:hypothetical protein
VPQREPLGAPRSLLVQPHGKQDMGGPRHPGGAGGTRGRFDARKIQQEQEGVALAPRECELRMARLRPLCGSAPLDRFGDCGPHSGNQLVPQRRDALRLGSQVFGDSFGRRSERGN